jgi:hypothetical protein
MAATRPLTLVGLAFEIDYCRLRNKHAGPNPGDTEPGPGKYTEAYQGRRATLAC